jgi:aminopeptidase N
VINSIDTTFEFSCPAKPDNVVFDSDKYLLCALVEDKPLEWFAWQAVNGDNYKQREVAINALGSDLEGKDFGINAIKKALEDPFWALRLEAIQALDGYSAGHSESLITLIRKRAETDNTAAVRAAAVRYLAQVRQDAELVAKEPWRKDLINVFRKALKDSSYAVVGAALEAINESNDQEALAAARELMKNRCNAELRGKISNILMAHDAPEAYDFVMESLEKAGGLTKYYLIEQFGSYLGGLSDNVKEKGIEVLKDLAQNSGAYYHRLAAYKALKAYDNRADVKAFREHLRKTETHPQLIELYRSGL